MSAGDGWFHVYVDGASRGNPGPAAVGVVVEGGGAREEIAEYIGVATNNAAEYRALIRGLEAARARGARRVRVFSDSQLLVRQLQGAYQIKSGQLAELAREARRLMAAFAAVEVRHVPRAENAAADRLANAALDAQARAPRRVALCVVDAFTHRPLAGNPAGVVPDASGLAEAEMQALARELGVSETAFVLPPAAPAARIRLRFFTPVREVPLCGHAAVAAIHLLAAEGRIKVPAAGSERLAVETGAGLLRAEVEVSGGALRVWLELAAPRFRAYAGDPAGLAAALGLEAGDLHRGLPPALAYSGLWHLLVPLARPEDLVRVRPDAARLAALNAALGVHTTHVYAPPPTPPAARLEARGFGPAIGIDEDPQTGTANGALAAWLAARGWLEPATADPGGAAAGDGMARFALTVEQGRFLGRPGEVRALVEAEASQEPAEGPWRPARVLVGGGAALALRGEAYLPARQAAPLG